MSSLRGREHRLVDVSKVRDLRFKGAGIHINDDKRARCSAQLCDWITEANSAYGGTSPFPYGVFLLQGDPNALQDPPADLLEGPFLEMIPCDRPDRRAIRLIWSQSGTEAEFGFAAIAAALGIDAPKGSTLWIDAVPLNDTEGKPVMVLPVGHRIKRQAPQEQAALQQQVIHEPAASRQQVAQGPATSRNQPVQEQAASQQQVVQEPGTSREEEGEP